jgi:hypothetical protein
LPTVNLSVSWWLGASAEVPGGNDAVEFVAVLEKLNDGSRLKGSKPRVFRDLLGLVQIPWKVVYTKYIVGGLHEHTRIK